MLQRNNNCRRFARVLMYTTQYIVPISFGNGCNCCYINFLLHVIEINLTQGFAHEQSDELCLNYIRKIHKLCLSHFKYHDLNLDYHGTEFPIPSMPSAAHNLPLKQI